MAENENPKNQKKKSGPLDPIVVWAKAMTLDSEWVKYDSLYSMCAALDVDKRNVYKVLKGVCHQTRGYIFRTDEQHQLALEKAANKG